MNLSKYHPCLMFKCLYLAEEPPCSHWLLYNVTFMDLNPQVTYRTKRCLFFSTSYTASYLASVGSKTLLRENVVGLALQ